MEGFFAFLGVLLVTGILVVPVILMVMVSGLKGQVEALNRRIMQLSQDLKNMAAKPVAEVEAEPEPKPAENVAASYVAVDHKAYMPQESVTERRVDDPKPEVEQQEQEIPVPERADAPVAESVVEYEEPEPAVEEIPVAEPEPEPVMTGQTPEPAIPQPSVQERRTEPVCMQHPKAKPAKGFNFEQFIGENLINKIGIGALVIGIGLFVKYAIDNDWINEIGRVVIGFVSGGVLLALAYRFRKTYRAFSSVLTGGALALFYFTVAIAFREYNLFGQTGSFLMMVAVTAFSVWLSMLYNRRELAILSLIGGMLTPFMVGRGDGNYHVLFTYIAILNTGMLTLSLHKQWKELPVISFIGTQLIFWLYYSRDASLFHKTASDITRDSALLLYASVFYIIFLLMPLVQVFRGRDRSKNHALYIIMLVANSFFYLLAGVLLLQRMEADSYKGLLTALLAVINAVIALMLYGNKKDQILFHLFAGLTISYVTLAVPMQFNGSSITLFWATEAVLLLWLFRKSNAVIYYCGSLILLAFTSVSMLTLHGIQDMSYDYEIRIHRALEGSIFVNRYFITRLYVSLALVVSGLLLRLHCNEHSERKWVSGWLPTAIGAVAAVMLFYTGNREIYMYTGIDDTSFWKMAYILIFICGLTVIIGRRASACLFRFIAVISLWSAGCLYYWLMTFDLYSDLVSLSYNHKPYALPVALYWSGFAALCGLFATFARIFYKKHQLKSAAGKTMIWFFNAAAVITLGIASVEVIDQINLNHGISVNNKATVTILWSLCAFVQMWLGMHLKYKTLRIISLSLLGLALCKLFMYDLSNVSQGAKIIAFVVLGVVLLVLSFLYQKLKKILFEDDEKSEAGLFPE
ncbi:MAG: DUF2339 domain-containing protein [Bacteroidales bacterium]|jgi:uncharacterized membrane protein|nr:DUF2339 domain-containing protein [Bacteroidales bacterium]